MFATYSYNYHEQWWGDHHMMAGVSIVWLYIALVLLAVTIVAMWRTYKKAGQPGWASIIPIYNIYVLLKIAGRPGWWLLWYFVPLANVIVGIVVSIDVAHAFKKSTVFGVLAYFFPFVGYWILGYGDAKYKKPAAR